MDNLDEKIERIMTALEVDTYKEVADILNKRANLVSTWKKRKKIPFSYFSQVAKISDKSIDWLMYGQEATATTSEPEKPYRQGGDKRKLEAIFNEDEYNYVERVIQMIKSKSPIGQDLKGEINKYFYKWVDEEKRRMENEGNKRGTAANNQ